MDARHLGRPLPGCVSTKAASTSACYAATSRELKRSDGPPRLQTQRCAQRWPAHVSHPLVAGSEAASHDRRGRATERITNAKTCQHSIPSESRGSKSCQHRVTPWKITSGGAILRADSTAQGSFAETQRLFLHPLHSLWIAATARRNDSLDG